VVVALVASGLLAAACGIDFVGSLEEHAGGADSSTDGAFGDRSLPSSCVTLDASCLGTLPDIWKPISVAAPGCEVGFSSVSLVVNPRNAAGSCACGACRPQGSYTCTGTTAISGGNTCDDSPIAQAPPGTCTNASAQHLRGTPPKASGNVTCFAPNDAGTGPMADELAVCVPGCSANFCGSASRCVIAEGAQACPSGFKLQAQAGTGVDPQCPPCECEAGVPGKCEGTVLAFDNANCPDSGTIKTYAVGTCNTFPSGNYDSVLPMLVPPDASCFAVPQANALTPDAALVGAKTICCQ
jgi:hypothetical protein